MEESEFGSSSDNENDDIRVPALPPFSPILVRGGRIRMTLVIVMGLRGCLRVYNSA